MKAFDVQIHSFTRKKETAYTKDVRTRKVEVEKESINIEAIMAWQSVNSHQAGAGTKYSFKATAKRTKTTGTSITEL